MTRHRSQGLFRFILVAAAAGLIAAPRAARAAVYRYVDWTAADVARGTATGTITLPDASTVTVNFAATTATGAQGQLYGAQVDPGTNYWMPSVPYISTQVENAPPSTDILQLAGGLNQIYTVTLSEPIKDPIMAIVSLGAPGNTITYDFDSPFTIVSQGAGYWGGSATALVQLPGDVLQGTEGHGTIQFIGTFATFSWTAPNPETWHGFTFGIRTTERLEPTPDGGAGGAGGAGGTGGTSGVGGTGGAAGGAGGASGTGGATGGGAGSGGTGGAATGGVGGTGGAGGTTGAGGIGGAAGTTGGAGTTGAGGISGGAGTTGSAGIGGGGAGGRGGTGGAKADGSAVDAGDDGGDRRAASSGCGCDLTTRSSGGGAVATLLVALGLTVRRRRRS